MTDAEPEGHPVLYLLTLEFGSRFWALKNAETANSSPSAILEDESWMMMSADHKPWQGKNVSDSTRRAMLRVQVIF
jgi:hypothetical protein